MTTRPDEHPAQALLGAYALGALDPEEARSVEEHLPSCADCRGLLADYRRVGQGLLHLAPAAAPPRRLRASLQATLASGAARKPSRPRRLQSLAWVGGGLLVAAMAGLSLLQLLQARAALRQVESLRDQQQAGQIGMALSSYPTSRVVLLEAGEARGTLVYDPQFALATLYIYGLSDPAPQGSYQAWLISPEGGRHDAGLLQFPPEQGFAWMVVRAPRPLREYAGIGLTLEPPGGSSQPSGPRILSHDF